MTFWKHHKIALGPFNPAQGPLSMTKINIMYSIVKSHDVHVADDMAANVDRPDDVVLTWPMMWHWHD